MSHLEFRQSTEDVGAKNLRTNKDDGWKAMLQRIWRLSNVSCMCAKSLLSCLILCDPMDCSPPGSSVHGILQARTPEWVAYLFSRASSQPSIKSTSVMSLALSDMFFTISTTWETQVYVQTKKKGKNEYYWLSHPASQPKEEKGEALGPQAFVIGLWGSLKEGPELRPVQPPDIPICVRQGLPAQAPRNPAPP